MRGAAALLYNREHRTVLLTRRVMILFASHGSPNPCKTVVFLQYLPRHILGLAG